MDEPVKKHEMTPDHHDNIVHDDTYQKHATDSIIGTIGIVMALMTLIGSFLPYYGWLSLISGVIAIGLGIYAVIGSKKHGYSSTKGWIAIGLSVAAIIFFIVQNLAMSADNL